MAIDRPLVWLKGEVKTPPFSRLARIETGVLLRRLQKGESVGMPHSRPIHLWTNGAMNCAFVMKASSGD